MRLNLSKIIFVLTLLFAFDISADKKIPLLEKDLYLNGTKLSLNAGANNYSVYDLLIHIYNDDEKSEVLSDVYVYVIDQNINRNEYKKLTECETHYDGDGNEFIYMGVFLLRKLL